MNRFTAKGQRTLFNAAVHIDGADAAGAHGDAESIELLDDAAVFKRDPKSALPRAYAGQPGVAWPRTRPDKPRWTGFSAQRSISPKNSARRTAVAAALVWAHEAANWPNDG
jgi:hypothetical protein